MNSRKILVIILVIALVLGLVPGQVLADSSTNSAALANSEVVVTNTEDSQQSVQNPESSSGTEYTIQRNATRVFM